MIFHQTIDLNMKFRCSLIINDHQVHEKHQNSSIPTSWNENMDKMANRKLINLTLKTKTQKLTDAVVLTTLYFICNVLMSPI